MIEKRNQPRVACKIHDLSGRLIRNISVDGLYLESPVACEPDGNMTLSFTLPFDQAPINLSSEIVRQVNLPQNRYGYGVRFNEMPNGTGDERFERLQQFVRSRTRQSSDDQVIPAAQGERRVFYRTIVITTKQQNLTDLDPRLAGHLGPADYFYVHDLTSELRGFVQAAGISHGSLLIQVLHTSASLCVNELDEPMLLMDLAKKMRDLVPKETAYFHNGPMRTVNLCEADTHCDRNADAHVRAAFFGLPSVTLIIRDGELVLGEWQKVALIEFDGPRRREVVVQGVGIL